MSVCSLSSLAAKADKVERQMQRELETPTPLHAADLQFQAFVDFDTSEALSSVHSPTLARMRQTASAQAERPSASISRSDGYPLDRARTNPG